MRLLAFICSLMLSQGPVIPLGSIGITTAGATLFNVVERQTITSTTNCATGLTITLGTPTAAPGGVKELIATTYAFANPSGAISITDSGSQVYTSAYQLTNVASHDTTGVYYFLGSAAGITSVTIKAATSATSCQLIVEHVTRTSGSWALDQSGNASSTGVSTPWSSPAVTTLASHEFLIGAALAYHSGGGNCVMAATGLWTGTGFNGTLATDLMLLDQPVSSIQTNIQATGTTSTCTTFGGAGNYPGIRTFQ